MSITDQEDLNAALKNQGTPVAEDDEPEEINDDDIPQEYTESYGTGVHELPGYIEGGRTMHQRDSEFNEADAILTGGDIDANYEQANAVGDEAVGGTVATPDQDIVDELGEAVGLNMADGEWLHTDEILTLRDDRRWELEPKSSEDYEERRSDEELY
ncbi:DUF6335 family protein [Chroococcus sp. FPU101]|uniref:DUF6335 family protein n=1 Tax=Chroococcus sp. FPU101 TaxID=1974212 RepID=UPI001AA64ABC|nr:DUF6335 family protein [Chroococcus sp. FPU101]GFE71382.1 hypothetical protein CFPU101_39920 [Chroococcus sp. FPU101]